MGPGQRHGEAGFSLAAVLAGVTVMLILMGAAVPSWQYVMRNAREEELIFRGTQIVEAIERYQRRNRNAAPVSLEMLVEGKYLRRLYKDPMTRHGEWRLIRPGEILPAGAGAPGGPTPSPRPGGPVGSSAAGGSGEGLGAIMGVASRSREKGIRLFNGRSRYHEWAFAVGQPRVVGRDRGRPRPSGVRQRPDDPTNPTTTPRP